MGHFKALIEFAVILFLFCILVFGYKACGILTPQLGIELALPALKVEILPTLPPGNSLTSFFFFKSRQKLYTDFDILRSKSNEVIKYVIYSQSHLLHPVLPL